MDKLKLLEEWEKVYRELDSLFDSIHNIFGTHESILSNTVWRLFDRYTDTLSILIGDKNEWLPWWQGECNIGKNPLSARLDTKQKFKKIKSLKDLLRFIEADQPNNK